MRVGEAGLLHFWLGRFSPAVFCFRSSLLFSGRWLSGHCCRAAATLLTSNLPPTPTPYSALDNTNLLSSPRQIGSQPLYTAQKFFVAVGTVASLGTFGPAALPRGRPTGFINSLIAGGTQ